jgi:hypothetical protein
MAANRQMYPVILVLLASFLSLSHGALARQDHDHDHDGGVGFATLDDGWVALDQVSAEIRTAVMANNLDALHDLSTELCSVADSLGRLASDVPQANQLRFTSTINQLRTLSDRLHTAHERGDAAAAQQMVPQLNGVVQLLMVSAEAD